MWPLILNPYDTVTLPPSFLSFNLFVFQAFGTSFPCSAVVVNRLFELNFHFSLSQAKLETKALKAKRPGFTDERYNETSYYIENGLYFLFDSAFFFASFLLFFACFPFERKETRFVTSLANKIDVCLSTYIQVSKGYLGSWYYSRFVTYLREID